MDESRMNETDELAPDPRAASRPRTLGWAGLAAWAGAGLALEAAHGLKLSAYLDDELTRLLLTLAHAHGALLSIVLLLYGHLGAPLLAREDALTQRLLVGAWAALPAGFALSVIAHPEGDPGVAIVLVPFAGLALVVALVRLALASSRAA